MIRGDAGLQREEGRVHIYGTENEEQLLHVPPSASELPERLERLCSFVMAKVVC